MREKEDNDQNEDRSQGVESGVRAPLYSLTSDCDIPPLTGKPPPSPAKVRNCERQIFLVGVEASAVLGDEHSPNRGRFDGTKKKAGEGKRKQLVQIIPVNRWHSERRNSLRHGRQSISRRVYPVKAPMRQR